MSRLSPVPAPETSVEDDRPCPAISGTAPDAEARIRDAEERREKAQQRAVEAEQRAAAAERRVDALLRALETRGPIDQAKGIVMAVFGLDPDAAFDALVWVSQHANTKLCTVAERFLSEVRNVDLGERAREDLTSLLADLGRPDRQHVT